MRNLKIDVFRHGQTEKPEAKITIPLKTLLIAVKLLPKSIRATLEKEGIDLAQCSELTKEKDLKGTLIEIENSFERFVISAD